MTTHKSLAENASLDFERKQARALVKAVKVGDVDAIDRVRLQLSDCDLPISLRDAQLVVAREYGYSGWPHLSSDSPQIRSRPRSRISRSLSGHRRQRR